MKLRDLVHIIEVGLIASVLNLGTSLCPAQNSSDLPTRAAIEVVNPTGKDIASDIDAAIARLTKAGGTVQLPAGSFVLRKTIVLSGSAVRLVGNPAGTVLTYDSANYHLLDSADIAQGWSGSGASVSAVTSIGEDHPDPIEGTGYLRVATKGHEPREVSKEIPITDFKAWKKLGVWLTLNQSMGPAHEVEFFASDGTQTAFWKLMPNNVYGQWKLFELDPTAPSGTESGMPNLNRITRIGFRNLLPNVSYYIDAISLYTPIGASIVFSSCTACGVENLTISWEPATAYDAVISLEGTTRNPTLKKVRVAGGANGFDFGSSSGNSSCQECVAEKASRSGFELRSNTSGNQLLNIEASHNVFGLHIAQGATQNVVSSPRFTRNNNAAIFVDGDENQITGAMLDTWMTFGLVFRGGSRNTISDFRARSRVGESAVQFLNGATENTLSSVSIEQAGGSGLDMGGGTSPVFRNTITGLTVRNSGSSAWHGGAGGSAEGRGLVLGEARDNYFSQVKIYDTGQSGTLSSGVEGIIVTNGASGNQLEDVLVENSRHEGVTVWDSENNQFHKLQLINNGHPGRYFGMRITPAARNTTVAGLCHFGNSAGGLSNQSASSIIEDVRSGASAQDCQ